jgi:hypothetical protein
MTLENFEHNLRLWRQSTATDCGDDMTYQRPPNLRAELDAAQTRIAALEAALQAFVDERVQLWDWTTSADGPVKYCLLCDKTWHPGKDEKHTDDCAQTQARALLAEGGDHA